MMSITSLGWDILFELLPKLVLVLPNGWREYTSFKLKTTFSVTLLLPITHIVDTILHALLFLLFVIAPQGNQSCDSLVVSIKFFIVLFHDKRI